MSDELSNLERTRIPFGKHKGETFDDIPLPYLDWLNGQDWFQEKFEDIAVKLGRYLRHPTIAAELEKEMDYDR